MPAQDHPVFEAPDDRQVPIWRYMDFTKFVSTLENAGLFFARADNLGDPFEGSYSRGNEALRPMVYEGSGIPDGAFQVMGQFTKWVRQWTFLNCWHMNYHESAAMWNLYTRSNEAIAVKSTYAALYDCLSEDCHLGVVKYIDYESEWLPEGNSMYPFVHKRLSFSHEQELRALIHAPPTKDGKMDYHAEPPDGGRWVPVDLETLITDIYIAPTAPTWYRTLVGQVLGRYGVDLPVHQSALDREPFF